MKKIISIMLTISLIMACFTGCGSESAENTDAAKRTDVIIAQHGEPPSLDPHACGSGRGIVVIKQMFESLLRLNPDGSLDHWLAKDHKISEDGLTYTYYLRDDVNFQNGDHMTAADVKYSLDRACESPYCEEGTYCISEVNALDDYTVEVKLSTPFALLDQFMATTYTAIVNKNVVEEKGENFGTNPFNGGTGPYIFQEWNEGTSIKLNRNENYWGELPYMTKVEYRRIAEANTGALSVESGDIDAYIDPSLADTVRLADSDTVAVYTTPGYTVDYMCFNRSAAPFDNINVRKAIEKCINREDIVSVVFRKVGGEPAGAFVSSALIGHSDTFPAPKADIEEAKKLLADAGYADGFTFTITCRDGRYKNTAQIIQAAVAQIGLKAEIEVLEGNAFNEQCSKGSFQTCVSSMSSSVPDAYSLTTCIFGSKYIGLYNFAQYNNPEVEALFEKSCGIIDTNERIKCFDDIQKIVLDEMPIIPLVFSERVNLVNKKLNGWTMHAGNTPYVDTLSW